MAAIAVFLLAGLLLASPSWARRPKPSQSPIDKISAQEGFDPTRFAGKWFLVGVASDCLYLRENGYQVEATNVVVSVRDRDSLHFSTFRPLEGICWNIKQNYFAGKAPGRFLLKGRAAPVDVVVGETDYSSHAILYFQKNRKISAKLYGRTAQVENSILKKFEAAMTALGFSDDLIFYYPVYGFCSSADQFHILDETKFTG
ncbi:complement component C8 gamma chain isoform X1 [Pseudonaja textilis]|uniref:complement component C8 gamma chain isoform X1 n=1 Tax=Pseudonaja textilis TaxID=8673 RepID=UPI000EA87CA1|nr:complement component C8 gamma chain isoform X1 [Pseudonaja textilis]